jgi:hypothetical protein
MQIESIVQEALQIGGDAVVGDCGRSHHHRNTSNKLPPFAIGTTLLKRTKFGARHPTRNAQMMMLMGIRLNGGLDSAQTRDAAQLGAHHRHKMVPAFERFVVGISVMPLDNFPKLPPIDRFEELPKDAIHVLHARPFSESRQPESMVHAAFVGHALRHSESFPGQPCRKRERVGWRVSQHTTGSRVRRCAHVAAARGARARVLTPRRVRPV